MHEDKPLVAYFCMEYGLADEMKIYSGGLGILAGDILKAARESDFPIFGIGIMWRQGYTKQVIDEDGRPVNCYPRNDYMYNYLEDTGVEISLNIRGREVAIKVWKLDKYKNAPLYLLDTNLEKNPNKWITGQLYGWFEEERVAQEIVLGVGGVKAIRSLGLDPDIYHFNEGHAVLAGTQLIKEKMNRGMDFRTAFEGTRREIVFTTHTPIEQGNEKHSLHLLNYMGAFNDLDRAEMEEIGGDPFDMTAAGLRLSKVANGVSKLHGKTAREMWKDVDNRAEIKSITNGIHQDTWVQDRIAEEPDSEDHLWEIHRDLKDRLIQFVSNETGVSLDKDALLIGFARRAVPYKRADLIFWEEERIAPYLNEGRVQIVFAGKAHPFDDAGKEIIERLVAKTERYPQSVVFLEDYGMKIGRLLTQGSDLWLNNPRKPLEASGTSGMKAAMNGVLNLSILDGWWPEVCEHGENGWQIGDGYTGEGQDEHDARSLYEVLLNEVVPTYYHEPRRWKEMMVNSVRSTNGRFSAKNMLRKYYEKMYSLSPD